LDWLTLASLRDSSNAFRDYDEVSDKMPGITLPDGLVNWFTKIGSTVLDNNTSLFFSQGLAELVKLNQCYTNRLHVVVFVAAKVIDESNSSANTKDHWIVLASNIMVNNQPLSIDSPLDGIIDGKFFTWGTILKLSERTRRLTLREFLNHFYGGLAFQPIR
ncbi:hypothetical protein HYE60_01870, partial [Aggregatibacter actinomycetemcomitans]|nr:hypothetical protein [Aggregatibacter actinomycetemcomitans]